MGNDFLEKFSIFFMKLAAFFIKLAIFCVVIYLIGIRLFDFGHRLFYEKAMSEDDSEKIVFEIKQGDTDEVVAENLEKAGLIDDTLAFRFRAKIYKTNLTPNIYNLDKTMTIKNILDIFDSPNAENLAMTNENEDVYQLAAEDDVVDETEELE